jgi:hypothetical protein
MFFDGAKQKLLIHGKFGSSQGVVWVDNIEPTQLTWSDSLLSAVIPDSARGSAGPVIVEANSYLSNTRFLSRVHVEGYVKHLVDYGNGWQEVVPNERQNFSYTWRYDFHSFFVNHNDAYVLNYYGVKYDFISAYVIINDNYRFPLLKDYFIPDFGETAVGYVLHQIWVEDYESNNEFPPPKNAIVLYHPVQLTSPVDGARNLDKWNVVLRWDTLKYNGEVDLVESYHLQVAREQFFSNIILDTTLSDFSARLFPLSDLSTYYWRVAGVNSEGESRWSAVWKFTTSATSSVDKKEQGFSINVYPNPANYATSVLFKGHEGENLQVQLFDLLGRPVVRLYKGKLTSEEVSIPLDLSNVIPGMYVLHLQCDNSAMLQKFQIIK